MNKYETLLNAVLALDPFESYFCVTNSVCWHCDAHKISGELDYEVNHTPECPVALLRNILTRDYTAACDRSALQLKKDMEATLILSEANTKRLMQNNQWYLSDAAKDCTPLNERVEDRFVVLASSSPILAAIEAQNKTNQTILPKYITSPTDNGCEE